MYLLLCKECFVQSFTGKILGDMVEKEENEVSKMLIDMPVTLIQGEWSNQLWQNLYRREKCSIFISIRPILSWTSKSKTSQIKITNCTRWNMITNEEIFHFKKYQKPCYHFIKPNTNIKWNNNICIHSIRHEIFQRQSKREDLLSGKWTDGSTLISWMHDNFFLLPNSAKQRKFRKTSLIHSERIMEIPSFM